MAFKRKLEGFLTPAETEVKHPRLTKVKNETPFSIQITSEHILREAKELQESEILENPKQLITDSIELYDYRLQKRNEFENLIRRIGQSTTCVWVRYAKWEEYQQEFNRARSIWERALEINYRNHTIWLNYAEFEMNNRFINNARNVFDRAITLLSSINQLWYKYIHLEETLGNVAGARQIFERWMSSMPDQQCWISYVNFELRYDEIERARSIFERLVSCYPKLATAWIRFVKFEMKNGEIIRARDVYRRALEKLSQDKDEGQVLFVAFSKLEGGARISSQDAFEKLDNGDKDGQAEGDDIVGKKRLQYEEAVRKNPLNYNAWFDFISYEKSIGKKEKIREVFERAIANVPNSLEKRCWKRYIYLWIGYALYEELDAEDTERTRQIYKDCLKLMMRQKKFSFSKIWIMAAKFEIRQKNIEGARNILGNAIGVAPKDKIFKNYIDIEFSLGNVDRCRNIYEKYLEWAPENWYAWRKYAEFEKSLGETERARAILELGVVVEGI